MTLSQLVTDLATSQRLKDAGFPQDTALVWVKLFQEPWLPREVEQVMERGGLHGVHPDYILCAAPTAGELEEWLRAKYPYATISSFRRGDLGMDADIDDDVLNYHGGVGQYPTHVAALAALVLEVAG